MDFDPFEPFSLHDQKVMTKNLNILRSKRAFKVKEKAFFIIFKGLSVIKNCLSDLRVRYSEKVLVYAVNLQENTHAEV